MSSAPAAVSEPRTSAAQTVMRTFRDRPVVPLLVLLGILALAFIGLNPRTNITEWVASTLRAAIPLAILAGCQTIVMLTGGIDLSVAATASMSAFVAASLLEQQGLAVAIIVPLVIAVIIGVINGIGSGVFRVHPLIMTLGMGLVVFGASNAWQLLTVKTSSGVPPEIRQIGSATVLGFVPVSLVVFVPLALIIVIGLRRTGYGRLLYAIGDNPIAARLSGARSWQVLVVLYAISAVLVGGARTVVSLQYCHPSTGIQIDDVTDRAADVDRLDDGARRRAHALPRARLERQRQLLGADRVLARAADELSRAVQVEEVRGPHEVGHEARCRLLVELARSAELLDAPRVEHGDPVGERERLLLVVRDEDERDAKVALDLLQLDLHLLAQLEIECAEGLVEQ